jgi:hypothetical protein
MDPGCREKVKVLLEEKKQIQLAQIQLQVANGNLLRKSMWLFNELEKVIVI